MNIIEYADRELLAMGLANVLAGSLKNALLGNDFVSFAVPGGTTPGPIFDMLSATELDWDRVHVLLSDERWVPESDEQSNARLVRAHLLTGPAGAARFIPYYREGMSPAEGCAAVNPTLDDELPLSLLLLGMGGDMHTASLFPGAKGLDAALASDAPTLCPIEPDGEVSRVTLSAPALRDAMEKHLVIYGDDKRAALEKAGDLSPEEAPIAAVWDDLEVHWAA
ncbi:6-phosphogluconolactonase [Sulfitobacter aestuarii]|uniref:6-phosphogluconolactonase n=1 Tax=Sulfitobacter aestuarii TaxID=2161676 RepID=A0ABW5U0I1_9RHOB